MKKEKRSVYLELANEIDCCICNFCKYADWTSEGCCEGYHECAHPIECVIDQTEGIEPGDDCWGFQPCHPLNTCVDIVGAIISQDYDEWGVQIYSRSAVTVFGRDRDNKGSKVRIGHNGREEITEVV